MTEKKVSRRGYMKYAGAGVVIIAGAAAGAYYVTRPKPAEEVTLNIAWVAESSEYAYHDFFPDFQEKMMEKMGVKVNVVAEEFEYQTLYNNMFAAFSAKTGQYDVVQVDYTHKGAVVEPGFVMPVDDWIKRDWDEINMDDVHPAFYGSHIKSGGKWYSCTPFHAGHMCFYYRTDIFEEYGFEIPQTWDDVRDIAKIVTDEMAPETYGLTLMCGREVQLMCTYWNFMGSYGGYPYDVDWNPASPTYMQGTFKPQANSEACTLAAETLKSLLPYCVPGVLKYGYDEQHLAFATGKAAMSIQWDDIVEYNNPEKSKIIGKWAIAPAMPGSTYNMPAGEVRHTAVNGGWGMFIPVDSKNKELAWEFIKWVSDPEIMRKMVGHKQDKPPWRISLLGDPQYEKEHPQYKALLGTLDAGPIVFMEIMDAPEIQDKLVLYLHEALSGDKTIKDAMDSLQADTVKIMEGKYY